MNMKFLTFWLLVSSASFVSCGYLAASGSGEGSLASLCFGFLALFLGVLIPFFNNLRRNVNLNYDDVTPRG